MLISHHKNIEYFIQLIKQHKINNTFILKGDYGIGKFTFAYHITKFFLDVDQLDVTDEYQRLWININQHSNQIIYQAIASQANVKIIQPLSNSIGVDQVKEINYFVNSTTLSTSNYKILIIDALDNLTINAQNALLKLLEESPNHQVITLLIMHSQQNILSTILSRALIIKFSNLGNNDLLQLLKIHNINYENTDIELCMQIANNSYGRLLILLDHYVLYQQCFDLLHHHLKSDIAIYNFVNEVKKQQLTPDAINMIFNVLKIYLTQLYTTNKNDEQLVSKIDYNINLINNYICQFNLLNLDPTTLILDSIFFIQKLL